MQQLNSQIAEWRKDKMLCLYAGAFSGVVFLSIYYLDQIKAFDLPHGRILEFALVMTFFILFFYFVAWKGIKEFWAELWGDEDERNFFEARSFKRFMYFWVGLLCTLIPGILVLFTFYA